MSDQLIENIRGRVAQCRRLAASINDADARQTLLQMAEEGETDLRKLEDALSQSSHR
jgi:hypothetical protein